MRFAHVFPPGSDDPRLVLVDGEDAVLVEELFHGAPRYLEELIAGGDAMLEQVRDAAGGGTRHPLVDQRYASALLTPR
nr:hypothetical protein GCM10025699_22130 [Microbacterium flavescens]